MPRTLLPLLLIGLLAVGCGEEAGEPPASDAREDSGTAAPRPPRVEPVIRLRIDAAGKLYRWGALSKFDAAEGWVHVEAMDLPDTDDGVAYLRHLLRRETDARPRLSGVHSDATLVVLLEHDALYAALAAVLTAASAPDVLLNRFRFQVRAADEGVVLDNFRYGRPATRAEVVATLRVEGGDDAPTLALGRPGAVQRTHLRARRPPQFEATWRGLFDAWRRGQARDRGNDTLLPVEAHAVRLRASGAVSAWSVVHLLRAAQEHGIWDLRLGPAVHPSRPPRAASEDAPRSWPPKQCDPRVRLRLKPKGRLERIDAGDTPTALGRADAEVLTELVAAWTFASSGTLTFELEVGTGTKQGTVALTLVVLRALLEDLDADDVPRGRGLKTVRILRRGEAAGSPRVVFERDVRVPDDGVLRLRFDRRGRLHVLTADGGLRALGPLDGTAAGTTRERLCAAAAAWTKGGRLEVDVEIEPGTPEALQAFLGPKRMGLGADKGFRFSRHVGPDGEAVIEEVAVAKSVRLPR